MELQELLELFSTLAANNCNGETSMEVDEFVNWLGDQQSTEVDWDIHQARLLRDIRR